MLRGLTVGRATLSRRHSKPGIEALKEQLQYLVGLLHGSGPRQAQLRHQPVLQGAEEALNVSLGLGRKGEDGPDP